jgi:hypothetical protein
MEPHKRSWPRVTIRAFSVLNLLLGFEGLAALLTTVATRWQYGPFPGDSLYYAEAFYFRSALNLVFIVLTVLAGIYLWRDQRRGWALCKVLFISEIAYFFLDGFNWPLSLVFGNKASLISDALAATAGTGNMGIVLQTITGYPVIALLALKIAFDNLQHSRALAVPPADPPSGG